MSSIRNMSLRASDNFKYPEYKKVNWLAGNVYEAQDDGDALRLNSETGWFTFSGFAREWMLGEFKEV